MTVDEPIRARIEDLVKSRQAAWRAGQPAGGISAQIDAAYAELRGTVARASHGSPDEIIKRARTERELERLMSGGDDDGE